MSERAKFFADRLRNLRENAGLSQYALAKLSGLSKQAMSRLELGDNEPTLVTVQLLAAALGADCREFADPTVKPPPTVEAKPRGRPRKPSADAAGANLAEPPGDAPQANRGPAKKPRKTKTK
jgi:transcriptional regulator with XRE-family HTH domain